MATTLPDTPELAGVRSLIAAERKIEAALFGTDPAPLPNVGQRRADLTKAIQHVEAAGDLIDEASYGLKGKGYCADLAECLRVSLIRLRRELD